tara:strand:+ start:735 stop:851 length:117 start_codon:yes stop_codon:yes gene_type:complete
MNRAIQAEPDYIQLQMKMMTALKRSKRRLIENQFEKRV